MKARALTLWNDPHIRQIAMFIVVGVVNTAIGYLLYAFFLWVGLPPQPALAVSFGLGVLWNYTAHARLVFGTRGYRRLPYYVAAYVGVYAMNAGLLAFLLWTGLHPLLAQALILPFAATAAYLGVGLALTGRLPVGKGRPRARKD